MTLGAVVAGNARLAMCIVIIGSSSGCMEQPSTQAVPGVATSVRTASSRFDLFTAHCCGVLNSGDVTVYDVGQRRVLHWITRGAANPMQLQIDSTGTLYVLNGSNVGPGGVSVTEYDRGQTRPSRRVGYFYWATAIALGASDNLYVANCNTCVDSGDRVASPPPDNIEVYKKRSPSGLRTITQGVHHPESIAFDSHGNLYVLNDRSAKRPALVAVYAPAMDRVSRKITAGLTFPRVLTIDDSDHLFVANSRANAPSQVIEYGAGQDRIWRRIDKGIWGPTAMTADASGRLYVANWPSSPSGSGWVSVYDSGRTAPSYQITKWVNEPVAVRIGPNGDLYVANIGGEGFISVYPPGQTEPSRILRGGRFGPPRALAFGPHD